MSEKAYVITENDKPVEIVLGSKKDAKARGVQRAVTRDRSNVPYRWEVRPVDLTVFRTALAYQIDAVRSAEGRILEILQELNRATGLQVVDVDLRYPNHPRSECPEILGVRVSCELDFKR